MGHNPRVIIRRLPGPHGGLPRPDRGRLRRLAAKQGQPTDVDSALHGAPSWFETIATDVPRATDVMAYLPV
jgi:hypothetical protein